MRRCVHQHDVDSPKNVTYNDERYGYLKQSVHVGIISQRPRKHKATNPAILEYSDVILTYCVYNKDNFITDGSQRPKKHKATNPAILEYSDVILTYNK